MSYSYSGNPADSTLDYYRFSTGDTGELAAGLTQQDDATPTTGFLLTDEEIDFVVDTHTGDHNVIMFTLYTAIANKVAKYYKRSLGPQSEDPKTMYKHYRELAAEYKAITSASDGLSLPSYNSDKVFSKGMHDNV